MIDRCAWAKTHPLLAAYHDAEWGEPEFDSRALWEKLMLDGFQAGLSWLTILKKRAAFREAFAQFDPKIVAAYNEEDVARLMANADIVRSRTKIQAVIGNARAYLAMQDKGEDFSTFIWTMAGGKPIKMVGSERPTQTALSAQISGELKQRGFKFVGPVIVYAWMQATGIVNDHEPACFKHAC